MVPLSLLSSLTAADLFHLSLVATATGHPMRLFRLPLVDKIDYICRRKFINSDSELEVMWVASLELGSFTGHIVAGNKRFMPILKSSIIVLPFEDFKAVWTMRANFQRRNNPKASFQS
jgi:hypothetical protein